MHWGCEAPPQHRIVRAPPSPCHRARAGPRRKLLASGSHAPRRRRMRSTGGVCLLRIRSNTVREEGEAPWMLSCKHVRVGPGLGCTSPDWRRWEARQAWRARCVGPSIITTIFEKIESTPWRVNPRAAQRVVDEMAAMLTPGRKRCCR